MTGKRGAAKNKKHAKAQKGHQSFLQGEEYQASGRDHIAWLIEQGFPEEVIAQQERQYKRKGRR